MGHTISTVCQLAFNVVLTLKVTNFTRYLDGQINSRETLNKLDTGNSSTCGMPKSLFAYAVRSHHSKSCDYYTPMSLMCHYVTSGRARISAVLTPPKPLEWVNAISMSA